MTKKIDKEEFINAAETLGKYCEEHCAKGCVDGSTRCLFYEMCDEYFIIYGGLSNIMEDLVHDVRHSDITSFEEIE